MKTKTLALLASVTLEGEHRYRIHTVTNSLEYNPGDLLDRNKVEELCRDPEWQVHIVAEQR
jgi:hypothetical protein